MPSFTKIVFELRLSEGIEIDWYGGGGGGTDIHERGNIKTTNTHCMFVTKATSRLKHRNLFLPEGTNPNKIAA